VKLLYVVGLLACVGAHAAAEDMQLEDLRIGAGILSNNFTNGSDVTVTSGNGSVAGSSSTGSSSGQDSHRNNRAEVQFMMGTLGHGGGFIYGADVAVNRQKFTNNADATLDTPVIDIDAGYGYALNKNIHFELTAFGGFGWTYYKINTPDGSEEKFNEHYLEYGGRLGAYYTFDSKWQVGFEVPYLVGAFHPNFSTTTSNGDTASYSNSEKNKGFGVLVQAGLRL